MTAPEMNIRKNTWLIHCEFSNRSLALALHQDQEPQAIAYTLFADNSGTLHRIQWYHQIWFAITDFITKGSTRAQRIEGLKQAIFSTVRTLELKLGQLLNSTEETREIIRKLVVTPRAHCISFGRDERAVAKIYRIACNARFLGLEMSVEERANLETIVQNSNQLFNQIEQKHGLLRSNFHQLRVCDLMPFNPHRLEMQFNF